MCPWAVASSGHAASVSLSWRVSSSRSLSGWRVSQPVTWRTVGGRSGGSGGASRGGRCGFAQGGVAAVEALLVEFALEVLDHHVAGLPPLPQVVGVRVESAGAARPEGDPVLPAGGTHVSPHRVPPQPGQCAIARIPVPASNRSWTWCQRVRASSAARWCAAGNASSPSRTSACAGPNSGGHGGRQRRWTVTQCSVALPRLFQMCHLSATWVSSGAAVRAASL